MKKFTAGWYESNQPITVVTNLSHVTKKNSKGEVEKTYGLWANNSKSFIKFVPGEPVQVTEELLELPNVQQLIERNILRRVYKD